jgi:imidazolonepropionase-like amidohydrolase
MQLATKAVLILMVSSTTLPAQMRPQPVPPVSSLIKAGRILDLRSGEYRLNQGILTDGERIKEVGPWHEIQARAPKDAATLDLSNATLLPGLIDCHAHLLISAELGRLAPSEIITTTIAHSSASSRALMGARNAREVLEAGFTSVRILGHSGIDGDVALRDAIIAGWIPGPRIQAAGRKVVTAGAVYFQPAVARELIPQEFLTVNGPEQARAAVRENLASGADLIKIVLDSDPVGWKTRYMPVDDARATVDEAHRLGMKVAAHAQDNVAVQIAIDAGVDSIEHAWTATDEQLKQMKSKGIFLVATDVFVAAPPKDRLQRAMRIGVKIAMGSDAWALIAGKTRGEETFIELKRLRDEGMPSFDIIRSATINAAELMGWSDRVGELAAGKFADIIAVSGDPLQDIEPLQHIPFVMKGGRVVRNAW